MPYCIYLRKSRADAEAEIRGEGETLARHEKALTAFAKHAGLEVNAIYREIISGETIAARPQMQKLLAEVSDGMWDGVIVMDVDRLARGNSIDQGIISQTFLFAGTKIITPTKTYDPSNEFDEEYFEFGLFMSRREYKIINRRLQRGRVASIKEGKYVSNKAPYGYERVKIPNAKGYTLSPIPEQAVVVKQIFEWYTQGILLDDGCRKHLGTSLIARELNSRKIPSHSGSVWTSQTIRDMLINPTYIGKLRWNWRPTKKKMKNGTVVLERPRSSDYLLQEGLHEPIVDEVTFAAAAKIMSKNKSRPVRGDKQVQNPLSSLVVCQKCGRKMQRRPNNKCPDLLICSAPTCDNHASYLSAVEARVIDTVKKWANGYLSETNRPFVEEQNEEYFKAELSVLLSSEAKLNSQLNKAYEAFETGVYDVDTFKQRSSALKQQLSELKIKKNKLKLSINKAKENERLISEFVPTVQRVAEAYDSLDNAHDKNVMLKAIIERIDYIKETRGHTHEEDFVLTIYPKLPKE